MNICQFIFTRKEKKFTFQKCPRRTKEHVIFLLVCLPLEVYLEIVLVYEVQYLLLGDWGDVTAGPAVDRDQVGRHFEKIQQEVWTDPVTLVHSYELQAREGVLTQDFLEEFVWKTADKLETEASAQGRKDKIELRCRKKNLTLVLSCSRVAWASPPWYFPASCWKCRAPPGL